MSELPNQMAALAGTPQERRPASSYLVHAGDVLVPGWFVAWLDAQVDLQRLRIRARDVGPQHVEVVAALLYSSAATSGGGRKPLVTSPEVTAPLETMSASQAAALLGITPRAVRLACSQQRLAAQPVDGAWRITRTDLETYRAQRAA